MATTAKEKLADFTPMKHGQALSYAYRSLLSNARLQAGIFNMTTGSEQLNNNLITGNKYYLPYNQTQWWHGTICFRSHRKLIRQEYFFLRVIARKINCRELHHPMVEFIKASDFTPFFRLNKHLFDVTASNTPTVPGRLLAIWTRVAGSTDIANAAVRTKGT